MGVIPGLVHAAAGLWHGNLGNNKAQYVGVLYICAWLVETALIRVVMSICSFERKINDGTGGHDHHADVLRFFENSTGK